MKNLIINITLLTLTVSAIAQRQVSYTYTEITEPQFDSCNITTYLNINPQVKKQADKLTIPISGKPARIFKDDNTNENFHEFEYLGDIKRTKLILLKRTDYNSEEFYIVNRSTGAVDTLIGQPVFAQNMRDFACLNNPKTDVKQQIQICELKNGSVRTRGYLTGKPNTYLESISCIAHNSILTKENNGKYWRINFKIALE